MVAVTGGPPTVIVPRWSSVTMSRSVSWPVAASAGSTTTVKRPLVVNGVPSSRPEPSADTQPMTAVEPLGVTSDGTPH